MGKSQANRNFKINLIVVSNPNCALSRHLNDYTIISSIKALQLSTNCRDKAGRIKH